jgi:hypothetical protein
MKYYQLYNGPSGLVPLDKGPSGCSLYKVPSGRSLYKRLSLNLSIRKRKTGHIESNDKNLFCHCICPAQIYILVYVFEKNNLLLVSGLDATI